ncbi:unnamed protein product [Caenorhabditis angaria]|uniref:Uncharacterized protein n=1 Tax=Caenorhabditis angaria TaxID=860376 RepID=A0A9P1N0A6_9PELO|nr:unnamed protein product [Caenorhabditis angaria]
MNRADHIPFWTPETFQNLVDKFIIRTVITQKLRDEIAKIDKNHIFNRVEGRQILKVLFDGTNQAGEIYGTPEELMHNLEVIQHFPNNSEFLGFPDDSMNFLAMIIGMKDKTGTQLLSKNETFLAVYDNILPNKNDKNHWKPHLIARSIGNSLNRALKGTFELTPFLMFQAMATMTMQMGNQVVPPKINFKVKSLDDLYSIFSQLYDKDHDLKLLEELREALELEVKKFPIMKNPEKYRKMFNSQFYWKQKLIEIFDLLDGHGEDKSWFNQKMPFVRVFCDEKLDPNKKFCIAKELENALDRVMKQKYQKPFPKGLFLTENEEDRKLGIIRVVEWETVEKVLKIVKLSINDFPIIPYEFEYTTRQNPVPVNSPYGKYCILARHAFCDVFEQIVNGVQFFQKCNKQNTRKVFDFFEKYQDVFSDSRNYRYFIETWKIEEIIDSAYEELLKYSTEKMYCLQKKHGIPRGEVMKILLNYAPNFLGKPTLRNAYSAFLQNEKQSYFDARDILDVYESSIKNYFLTNSPKMLKFLSNQGIVKVAYCSDISTGDEIPSSSSSTPANPDLKNYAEEYKKAFMTILPKIPYDKFIARETVDKWIDEELAGKNLAPTNLIAISKLEDIHSNATLVVEYLDSEIRNGKSFVKRRIEPMKNASAFSDLLKNHADLNDVFISAIQVFTDGLENKEGIDEKIKDFGENQLMNKLGEAIKEKFENLDPDDESESNTRAHLLQYSKAFQKRDSSNVTAAQLMETLKNLSIKK